MPIEIPPVSLHRRDLPTHPASPDFSQIVATPLPAVRRPIPSSFDEPSELQQDA